MNDCDQAPIQLYLRTLKFKFHVIFTYHKILFFLYSFPTTLNIEKTFLALGIAVTTTGIGVDSASGPWFADSRSKDGAVCIRKTENTAPSSRNYKENKSLTSDFHLSPMIF